VTPFLIAYFIAGVLVARLAVAAAVDIAREAGFLVRNVRGVRVPGALGFAVVVVATAWGGLGAALGLLPPVETLALSYVVTGMGVLGLVDDLMGAGGPRGLRGHVGRVMLGGVWSTGAFKAVGGLMLSLAAGAMLARFGGHEVAAATPAFGPVGVAARAALNGLVIALSANSLNALDTAPGRALKAYCAGCGAAVAAAVYSGATAGALVLPFLPLWAAVLAYAPRDLSGRGMMGDAGSNALGASFGVMMVALLDLRSIALCACVLAGFQLLGEFVSISGLLDRLQRPRRR